MKKILKVISAVVITLLSLSIIASHIAQVFGESDGYTFEMETAGTSYRLSIDNGLILKVTPSSERGGGAHDSAETHLKSSTTRAKPLALITPEPVDHSDLTRASSLDPNAAHVGRPPHHLIRAELVQRMSEGDSLLIALERSRERLFNQLIRHYEASINKQVVSKSSWLERSHDALRYLSLLALILLTLPYITYARSRSATFALSVIPYSAASCASLMVIFVWVLDQLYHLQTLQMTLGVLSVPYNTLHLDGLLAIKYAPTQPLVDHLPLLILENVRWESTPGYSDPWGTIASLTSQLHGSSVIDLAQRMIHGSEWLAELYGPLFAGASFYLIYVVIKPLMTELLKYPMALIDSGSSPSLRDFFTYLKQVLKVIWIELRSLIITALFTISLFALFFVFQLAASAIVGMSLAAVAVWSGELASLSVTVPEYSLAGVLGVVYLFLFLFNTSLALLLGMSVRNIYLVSRDKFTHKTSYRDYQVLTGLVRLIFISALPKYALQLITALSMSLIVLALQRPPALSMTLMMLAFLIPIGALWIYAPPTRHIWTLYRSDLLSRHDVVA